MQNNQKTSSSNVASASVVILKLNHAHCSEVLQRYVCCVHHLMQQGIKCWFTHRLVCYHGPDVAFGSSVYLSQLRKWPLICSSSRSRSCCSRSCSSSTSSILVVIVVVVVVVWANIEFIQSTWFTASAINATVCPSWPRSQQFAITERCWTAVRVLWLCW